jgi:hypothetical protein
LSKKISVLFFAATVALSFSVVAQNKKTLVGKKTAVPFKKQEEPKRKDNLNYTDARNLKQGLWFYEYEARMGEPRYYEYGNYQDDKKTGIWTRLDAEQRLMATETYTRGELNGVAQYYEEGRLVCVGNYRGIYSPNKYDSIWVTKAATYEDTLVAIPTEIGHTKHGKWRYYDAVTGHLTREEEYQVDNLIDQKDFQYFSPSDSLRIKKRNDNLPHNKKGYAKPPAGKSRSLIY